MSDEEVHSDQTATVTLGSPPVVNSSQDPSSLSNALKDKNKSMDFSVSEERDLDILSDPNRRLSGNVFEPKQSDSLISAEVEEYESVDATCTP